MFLNYNINMCYDEEKIINLLKETFFSASNICWDQGLKISWDNQKYLIDNTIKHPLIQKYPLNPNYVKAFLKKVIKSLEENSSEVHDEFYSNYCELTQCENDEDNMFYKHYKLKDTEETFVSVRESSNLIANGTTGLRTWEAALVLADWSICNREKFRNKNILELGSGLGLTGIVIAKLCSPASYTFSDCHPQVLNTLEDNVTVNYPDGSKTRLNEDLVTFAVGDHPLLNILNFDWNNDKTSFPESPDIVVGADLVYDNSIFGALCGVLRNIWLRNNKIEIILVSTIRNENTAKDFINHLDSEGWLVENLEHRQPKYVHWNVEQKYSILKIYK